MLRDNNATENDESKEGAGYLRRQATPEYDAERAGLQEEWVMSD